MGFFDVLKKAMPFIGSVGGSFIPGVGTMAGGAIGGAAGSALGSAMEGEGPSLERMMGSAAMGAATGPFARGVYGSIAPGAAAEEIKGGMESAAQTVSDTAPEPEGGFGAGLKGWWRSMSPEGKAMLVGQGLGTAADVYGMHQLGSIEEEQRKRRERLDKLLAPMLGETLRDFGG